MKIETIEPYLPLLHLLEAGFAEALNSIFDAADVDRMIRHAQEHFERIEALIPDVDTTSPWLKNLLGISYEAGLWQELENRGLALSEISVITQQVLREVSRRSFPQERIPEIRVLMCSETYVGRIAAQSQAKTDQEDWLFDCVRPNEGDAFDIGIDIRRCPVSVLCRRLGIERYFPYFCINDFITHGTLGIRLERTRTLAHGASSCDFRLTADDTVCGEVIRRPELLPEFNHGISIEL